MKVLLVLAFLIALTGATKPLMMRHLALQNPDLFEGDILGIESIEDRNAIAEAQKKWPGGVIPYVIDDSLSRYTNFLKRAMDQITEETSGCITYKARTNERNYIRIFKGEGCYSYIGMQNYGAQAVSLGEGCYNIGTIKHELLHAVGFYHEHNRSDRDDYLIIHWDNIKEGAESQFVKVKPHENILYNEFDYHSIMMYGEYSFSKTPFVQKTMEAKNGVPLTDPFSKSRLSSSDVYRIKKLYECK